jgi:Fe-Mn family superoxide dismutase
MPFELPILPYSFAALEPVIDAQTVEIHYTKHHATYLNNLNKALEKYPDLQNHKIETILADLSIIPEDIRTVVKNNGGGYYNHNLYWACMAPGGGGEPAGKLRDAILAKHGTFDAFKQEIEKIGLGRLGSGYAWLSLNKDHQLQVHSTLNQDCPLTEGLYPILVVDVWEHAYYLKYQNRRAEYLSNWWKVVNWSFAQQRFENA